MKLQRILIFLFGIVLLSCVNDGVNNENRPEKSWTAKDTAVINSIYRKVNTYVKDSDNLKLAEAAISEAWKQSIAVSYQYGVAEGYYYSARILEKRDAVSEATDYYEKARSIYSTVEDSEQSVNTHLRLADLYCKQDQLFLAHLSFRHAIRITKVLNDTMTVLGARANIAYADFKNSKERDYHGAIELLDNVKDELGKRQLRSIEGWLLLAYGDSYYHLHEFERAQTYVEHAKTYFEMAGDPVSMMRAVLLQAKLYHSAGDSLGLQVEINRGETLQSIVNNDDDVIASFRTIKIRRELQLGRYESALEQAEKLTADLYQQKNYNEIRNVLALMAKANFALGHFDDANSLFERYQRSTDSLLADQFVQADAELSDKFVLARQEDVDRLKFSNSVYQRYGFIAGLVVLTAILLILYIHFREKDKLATRVAIKNAEISAQNDVLKQANIQNEILLREIHHRVKNNLQIISSLLSLQARKTDLPEVVEMMKDSQSRLNSIALVHNKLYHQHSLGKLNIHEYIQQLAGHLLTIYQVKNKKIDIRVEAQGVSLNMDIAIPLGLILTELMTNSLKYAFFDSGDCGIAVRIVHDEGADYIMQYTDNGPGIPSGESDLTGDTLGFKLVHSLVAQLDGNIQYTYQVGLSTFKIRFQSHT